MRLLKVVPVPPTIAKNRHSRSVSECSTLSATSSSSTLVSSWHSASPYTASSQDSTTPSGAAISKIPNLLDQLSTSPETRFHAAYMFLRYFYLIKGNPGSPGLFHLGKHGELRCSEEEFELVIWDIAVGCLALSVKVSKPDVGFLIRTLIVLLYHSTTATFWARFFLYTPPSSKNWHHMRYLTRIWRHVDLFSPKYKVFTYIPV